MKKIQQEWTILEKDLPGKNLFFFFLAFANNLSPRFRQILFELQYYELMHGKQDVKENLMDNMNSNAAA